MKFEFFIAKRYLLKGRHYSFISTISIVSTIGIAIGVGALIIALSLINGFQNDVRDKILSTTAHIMITGETGEGLVKYKETLKQLESFGKGIISVEPVVQGTVLLKGLDRESAGVVLKGLNLGTKRREVWLADLKRGILPVKKNQLVIGYSISSKIGILEDEYCTVIAPQSISEGSSIKPKVKKIKVSGIFESGLYEMDNGTVITNLETAQQILGVGDKISYIQVFLHDIFNSEAVARKLRGFIPSHLTIMTWKDLKAPLYSALKMEKDVLFFTLTLIIVVASLNIIAGLILLVIQKIKDIGILLSYGATPQIIKKIFFIQGSIIGVLGTTAGVIIGLVFCFIANKFELIKIPSDFYQMSFVPFTLELFDLGVIVFISLFISFMATLIPSQKAASINVIDAIKSE